jgi:hypothetical protein
LADIPASGLVASAALRWIFTPTGDPLHFLGDWLPAILKRHATKKITISLSLFSEGISAFQLKRLYPLFYWLKCAPAASKMGFDSITDAFAKSPRSLKAGFLAGLWQSH